MHTARQMLQIIGKNGGMTLLLALVYGILSSRFYYTAQDVSVFIGMFRVAPVGAFIDLAYNMYPLMFMAGGVALTLERFSEYLVISDCLVYVRRNRGIGHFCRYLLIVTAYCLVFSGVQLACAVCVVPQENAWGLASGAMCAAWMLLVALLTINLGYVLGNRALGYFTAAAVYAALLSLNEIRRWLVLPGLLGLPHWMPVFVLATMVMVSGNWLAFKRVEII